MVTANSALPVAGESVPFPRGAPDHTWLLPRGRACARDQSRRWSRRPTGGPGPWGVRLPNVRPRAGGRRVPLDPLTSSWRMGSTPGCGPGTSPAPSPSPSSWQRRSSASMRRERASGNSTGPRWSPSRAPRTRRGPSGAPGRCWRGVDGIDLARSHKILHHKRPRVFPLIDNKTVEYLRSGSRCGARSTTTSPRLRMPGHVWRASSPSVSALPGCRLPSGSACTTSSCGPARPGGARQHATTGPARSGVHSSESVRWRKR